MKLFSRTTLKSTDRVILTDADGVLLNWEWAFTIWMQEHGFEPKQSNTYGIDHRFGIPKDQARKLVRMFNESASIGFIPAHRDAVYYVKRLHEEHGFEFHCITSLSSNINAKKLREMNIKKLFGDTAFTRFVILETGSDKVEALEEYKNSQLFWIEDKIENAEVGAAAGLNSILMEHGHNMDYSGKYNIPIAKNWKEIYQIILKKYGISVDNDLS